MANTNKDPQFTAYIPASLLNALKARAKQERRSANAQLVLYLERGLRGDETMKETYHYLVKRYQDGRIWHEGYSSQADALAYMERSNSFALKGEPLLEYVGTVLPQDAFEYEQEQATAYIESEFALPALMGSEKQVKWARAIRYRFVKYCRDHYGDDASERIQQTGSDQAGWWVENRYALAATNDQSKYIAEG